MEDRVGGAVGEIAGIVGFGALEAIVGMEAGELIIPHPATGPQQGLGEVQELVVVIEVRQQMGDDQQGGFQLCCR